MTAAAVRCIARLVGVYLRSPQLRVLPADQPLDGHGDHVRVGVVLQRVAERQAHGFDGRVQVVGAPPGLLRQALHLRQDVHRQKRRHSLGQGQGSGFGVRVGDRFWVGATMFIASSAATP